MASRSVRRMSRLYGAPAGTSMSAPLPDARHAVRSADRGELGLKAGQEIVDDLGRGRSGAVQDSCRALPPQRQLLHADQVGVGVLDLPGEHLGASGELGRMHRGEDRRVGC
jgi:hypothetical protein